MEDNKEERKKENELMNEGIMGLKNDKEKKSKEKKYKVDVEKKDGKVGESNVDKEKGE